MNLLAGKRDPLDFVLLALRSGYFFPTKVNYSYLFYCKNVRPRLLTVQLLTNGDSLEIELVIDFR